MNEININELSDEQLRNAAALFLEKMFLEKVAEKAKTMKHPLSSRDMEKLKKTIHENSAKDMEMLEINSDLTARANGYLIEILKGRAKERDLYTR